MRDPDLVLQAEQAASALERAWHRWRVVHGLAADPVPPVSSYVGYSLDEPWGQPRVVFGLAAEEAEQLATVLERHDCVGPVHAAVAALPSRRQPSGRLAGLALPLPVPPQAMSGAAGQRPSAQPQAMSGAAGLPPSAEAAGLPTSADWLQDSVCGSFGTSALTEFDDLLDDRRPASGSVDACGDGSGTAAVDPLDDSAGGADGPVFRQAAAAIQAAVAAVLAAEHSAVREHGQDGGNGHDTGVVLPTDLAAALDAGPLTQAASAAQAEAEARIKAALQDRQPAPWTQDPCSDACAGASGAEPVHAEPLNAEPLNAEPVHAEPPCTEPANSQPPYPDLANAEPPYPDLANAELPYAEPAHAGPSRSDGSDAYGLSDTDYFLAAVPRPEAASGARARPEFAASGFYQGQVPETGSAGGTGTECADTAEIHQQAVAAFRPQPELAAYLDAGPESSPFFDSPEDPSGATLTRRGRTARSYALPRMPRSKRPGASSGS